MSDGHMAYKGSVPEQVTKDNFNKHSGHRIPSPRSMPRPSRDRPNIVAASVQNRQRRGHSEEATYWYRPTVEKAWQDNCDRPFGTRTHQAINMLPLLFLTRQGSLATGFWRWLFTSTGADSSPPALPGPVDAICQRTRDDTTGALVRRRGPDSGWLATIQTKNRPCNAISSVAVYSVQHTHSGSTDSVSGPHQHGWPADAMFQDGLGLR